jgi:flagellin
MSSILTNNSAMVALQTLQSINKNLAMTQNEISTGKSISSAKDSSAIWAISQVMQSDVDGFDAISDSLALGESTVAVGRNAAEQVTSLLGQVKEKIVAAQEDNVDRTKLQTELASLRTQISGVVSAAQFNGQNLLSNRSATAGTSTMDVLASLDRSANGSVTATNITVNKADLGQTDSAAGTGAFAAGATISTAGAIGAGATVTYTITTANVATGTAFRLDAALFGGSGDMLYVAREGDTATDVAAALVARTNYDRANNGATMSNYTIAAVGGTITVTNNQTVAGATLAAADLEFKATGAAAAANTIGGGLELLGDLDISTANGAAAALQAIEFLTQSAIEAAAGFGTSEKRLEIQQEFVSKLTDSLKSGIGALVDADMEEASARLQALQVQQQLGIQSLSIANQAPQNVLALFR